MMACLILCLLGAWALVYWGVVCPSFLDFFVFEKINGFAVTGFVRLDF